MVIIDFKDVRINELEIIKSMKKGLVFIYPTDTIYGIGCNALNSKSVRKIRDLKERHSSPFSVIAPSIEWIKQNCKMDNCTEKWIKKLPGPYTLILNLNKKNCIAKEVNPNIESLGVRIPNHPISKLVSMAGIPFVTTSVNKSGGDFMTCLENLDNDIKKGIDIIIYEGKKEGTPSKIVDLTRKEKIIDR